MDLTIRGSAWQLVVGLVFACSTYTIGGGGPSFKCLESYLRHMRKTKAHGNHRGLTTYMTFPRGWMGHLRPFSESTMGTY